MALSGKVVEHELGYRAAEAEVIALAVAMGETITAATPTEIDKVLQQTHWQTASPKGCFVYSFPHEEAINYIQKQARRYQP